MRFRVYKEHGICVRSHCRAEPPRDLEHPGLLTAVGWRDRASTSYAAADRVQAPASAARAGFVESTVDAQRRLYRLKPEPLQEVVFFQAEDGIRYLTVTGVQTCALPI